MNVPFYIARKIQKARNTKGSIIGPVITAATLAIVLGMVLMLISLGTGLGLKRAISNKIIGFSGHLTITRYDINNSYEQQPISMDSVTAEELKHVAEVAHVQPFATKAGILTGADDFEGIVLKGVDQLYDWTFFAENMREGKIPTLHDTVRNDSVMISTVLASRLRIALHDTVRMYFMQQPPKPPRIRRFYVAGIFATGLDEFDKTYIIGDLKHVQRLNSWRDDEVGGYEVTLANAEDVDMTTEVMRAALPYDLDAKSVRSQNEQLFQWLDLFDLNIYLIIGIMLAVAIVNMVSALLILILDRTNMIGLLKALGMPNGKLMQVFLHQSASIILKGMFWGNLLGLGICWMQKYFGIVKLDPETYYVTQAPISIDVPLVLLLNAGVLLVCMLSLLIPALLVSKISPVRALRYE